MRNTKKNDVPLWLKIETDYSLLLRAYERCYDTLRAIWHLSEDELKLLNIHPLKVYAENNFYYKEELEKAHSDLHK